MKNFVILEIFWHNNWSENGERITMPFASEEEAREWCDQNATYTYESYPEDSNSFYQNGTEYRLIGEE